MRAQQVQRPRHVRIFAGDFHRHVPEALRREPQDQLRGVAVVRLAGGGIDGQQCIRHVAPEESLKGADEFLVDRKPREDEHAVLPFVPAETEGVGGVVGAAVVVEVDAAGPAGVHGADVVVGELDRLAAVLADGEILLLKQLGRLAGLVVVEFVDQHHIGADSLDHFGDLLGLLVVAGFEIGDQGAVVAEERRVVGGDADRFGGLNAVQRRRGKDHQRRRRARRFGNRAQASDDCAYSSQSFSKRERAAKRGDWAYCNDAGIECATTRWEWVGENLRAKRAADSSQMSGRG